MLERRRNSLLHSAPVVPARVVVLLNGAVFEVSCVLLSKSVKNGSMHAWGGRVAS